ncbi:hypothetical protein [Micromonospora sp. NPDC049662]|uniref:hypothetical protein n=1 Tax=Micromonospora sp. NPDC049662 TaxID=3155397 RepID=UPI00341446BA
MLDWLFRRPKPAPPPLVVDLAVLIPGAATDSTYTAIAAHAWWCGTCRIGDGPFWTRLGAVAGLEGHGTAEHDDALPATACIVQVVVDPGGLAGLARSRRRRALRAGLASLCTGDPGYAGDAIATVRAHLDTIEVTEEWQAARLTLVACCPHPGEDEHGSCTGCAVYLTSLDDPVLADMAHPVDELAALARAGAQEMLGKALARHAAVTADRALHIIQAVRAELEFADHAGSGQDPLRVLASCCPHPHRDPMGFCSGCGTEPPVGEWVLAHNPAGGWELHAGDRRVATTTGIDPRAATAAIRWAAATAAATGDRVIRFAPRPGRYGAVEYVAVRAASPQ